MRWGKKPKPDPGKETPNEEPQDATADLDVWNNTGLSPTQLASVKAQADTTLENPNPAGILSVYRYATPAEFALMALSAVCSIASGATVPLMLVVFGNLVGNISQVGDPAAGSQTGGIFGGGDRSNLVLILVYIAVAEFVLSFVSTVGWQHTGRRVTRKVREQYFSTLLRQNVGFFDSFGTGKVTSQLTSDMNAIQNAISEKVGLTIKTVALVIGSFIVGFVQYWALALILSSALLAIIFLGGALSAPMKRWTQKSSEKSAEASMVSEETFAAMKTVISMNMKQSMINRYRKPVLAAEYSSWGAKAMLAVLFGVMMCIVNLMYGLAFWQGNRFIQSGSDLDLAGVIITLLAVITGSFSIASMAPNFEAFVTGASAATAIFRVIDRESPIDVTLPGGRDAADIKGNIHLENIRLVYPTRPDVSALRGFTLDVPAGKTTALVGPSGAGKTSIVGLLERFYNPVEGTITVDGVDIKDYNLASLRGRISVVSQEPILFSRSIRDNIAFGLPEEQVRSMEKEKIDSLVRDAASRAHATGFIAQLPQGFDSVVGDRGVLLSGGQRQRVAVARAIISDPQILLLDEATSALDTESEREVQAALTEMSHDRTTIIIAHRLSTIRHADSIAVVAEGKVVEQSKHNDLLELDGLYAKLVQAQNVGGGDIADAGESPGSSASASLAKQPSSGTDQSVPKEGETVVAPIAGQNVLTKTPSSHSNGPAKEETPKPASIWAVIKFVYRFNRPERWHLLGGVLLSIISGAVQPVTAVLFAKSIFALALPTPGQYGTNFWAAMYLMVAFVTLLALTGRGILFGRASASLTRRIRLHLFALTLSKEAEWFDRNENGPGMLASMLSTEPENVAGVSGATLGTLIDGAVTLVGGCILALAIGWKLGLVCISLVPVLLLSGFLQVALQGKFQERAKETFEEAAAFACELIAGLRTVASLSREQYVLELYHQQLYESEKSGLRWVLLSSAAWAFSQATPLFIFALVFWYGGGLVGSGEYGIEQFFIVFAAVVFGAQTAAQFFGFSPDISKSRIAGARLLGLFGPSYQGNDKDLDHKPPRTSEKDNKAWASGPIAFEDVRFRYAGRADWTVLNGVNLEIKPGAFVALVGPSGGGKSTIISLIPRMYVPEAGAVKVSNQNIANMDASILRDELSLVSQEPVLFSGSIRENIIWGLPPNAPRPTDEQLEQSGKDANIHDFVTSLPESYDTVIGNKGVTLSGGQRQRITIARALLRNPRILLLDEATSALDSESEHLVQEALSRAAEGRTTIAVAHRLSTVKGADVIFVVEDGKVLEQGRHAELMARGGKYRAFVEAQDLGRDEAA
ncbi:hypothetical protein MBLNU230_g6564t1 [Neophaeotheca triangularis]